jgi:hypothetical protein
VLRLRSFGRVVSRAQAVKGPRVYSGTRRISLSAALGDAALCAAWALMHTCAAPTLPLKLLPLNAPIEAGANRQCPGKATFLLRESVVSEQRLMTPTCQGDPDGKR